MAYTIGAIVSVKGETEFTAAMRNLKKEMGYTKAEAAALTSKYGANEKSVDALRAKTEASKKVLELQKKAVKEAEDALDRMRSQGIDPTSDGFRRMEANLNSAKAEMNKTQREIEDTTTELKKMADAENGVGKESQGALASILDSGGKAFKDFTSGNWSGLISGAAGVTAGIAAVGAAAIEAAKGIWELSKVAAQDADNILTEATKYNLDTATYQRLDYASDKVDVSTETMGNAMLKLEKKMAASSDGFVRFGEEGNQASVRIKDSSGNYLDTIDVFYSVIDAIGAMSSEIEQDAAAQAIFGKSFADIKPLIDAGSDALKGYMDKADELGLVMSDEDLEAWGELQNKIEDINREIDAMKKEFAETFLPVLQDILSVIEQIVQKVREMIDYFNGGFNTEVKVKYVTEGITEASGGGWSREQEDYYRYALGG